jgi:hypothetical protein
MQPTYILLSPTNSYAVQIMAEAQLRFDLQPVLLWANKKEAAFWHRYLPELQHIPVLGEFYLDGQPLGALAALLAERFAVAGVIGYQEQTLELAGKLSNALNLDWNSAEVMDRFRDKNALKAYLRRTAAHIPMNSTRLVADAEQVLQGPVPAKYVIKPNDGMANRDIGFFAASTPKSTLEAYFAGAQGGQFVMEDFLEGPEYAINGQVDAQGRATVYNIFKYERAAGNGKPNLYRFVHHTKQSDPAFAPLAAYAVAVLEATGLRRAPFHMEAIFTEAGPRLIEVGARFGGLDYVHMTNAVHGGGLNAFAAATHYWLSSAPYGGEQGNWDFYNKIAFVQLDGICTQAGRIYAVDGMQAMEAAPEFLAWVFRPNVGKELHKTVDLYTIPYSFQVCAQVPQDELLQRALRIEACLKLTTTAALGKRLYCAALVRGERLALRLTSASGPLARLKGLYERGASHCRRAISSRSFFSGLVK